MQTVADRLKILPQRGRLEWIGRSSHHRSIIEPITQGTLIAEKGLAGDYHCKRRTNAKRQVTLIQREHLQAVGGFLHRDEIPPELLRRNLVVSGINLLALKGTKFRIGSCVLEWTGSCDPCSRMEENLGPGGLNAMRGHGGITARVIIGGPIAIGDEVAVLQPDDGEESASRDAHGEEKQGTLFS